MGCCWKMFLTFTSLSLVLLWQLFYLFCSSIVINTVIVTAGNFEPYWKGEVWCFEIWFNPQFLYKCLYQVRVITVFTVFRLLTDFVCLYTYEFWLSFCKIARSSVILLLPLFGISWNSHPLVDVSLHVCEQASLFLTLAWRISSKYQLCSLWFDSTMTQTHVLAIVYL
jgi:hypothetical protein